MKIYALRKSFLLKKRYRILLTFAKNQIRE